MPQDFKCYTSSGLTEDVVFAELENNGKITFCWILVL